MDAGVVYALDDGAISGYRVQVSTQPDFANGSIVDEATVAQPWHVSTARLYPNTVNASDRLYTRVQAISGAGQGLPWSTTTSFRKT